MAATSGARGVNPLVAAAFALPGVVPAVAHAQTPPDHGSFALNYMDYRDWQPGGDRMTVHSPSMHVIAPFDERYVAEASLTYDAMSGASPLWFNTLSGASGMGVTDYRTAGDVRITRYFDRYAVGVGGAYSHERDYISRAGSLDARWWTADKNTTLAFGFGGSADRISPQITAAASQSRHTLDFLAGVTQALSPIDTLQSTLTWSQGHGYYSDPYKTLDTRPDRRRIFAWQTRYNHWFAAPEAALQLGYRYLGDSFGGDSHTFEAAWAQSLPHEMTLTPRLRYYTQSAADFWYGPPFPDGFVIGKPYTADTRLSAFGAWTLGLSFSVPMADGWSIDLAADFYRQRSGWRVFGTGSDGILPFSARWFVAGIRKRF